MDIDELRTHIEHLMGRGLSTDEIVIMGVGYVYGLAAAAAEEKKSNRFDYKKENVIQFAGHL